MSMVDVASLICFTKLCKNIIILTKPRANAQRVVKSVVIPSGVPSVAAQGAAAECQGSLTAVRRDYAAAAKKSGPKAKDTEIRRLRRVITAMSEEAAAAKTKATSKINDLKQRLYDEKKITDGVLPARQQCVSKPLGRVQQSAQHRKQQSHVADVLVTQISINAEHLFPN